MSVLDSSSVENDERVAVMLMLNAWRTVPGARAPSFERALAAVQRLKFYYREVESSDMVAPPASGSSSSITAAPYPNPLGPVSSSSVNFLRPTAIPPSSPFSPATSAAATNLQSSRVGSILSNFGCPRERSSEMLFSELVGIGLGVGGAPDDVSGDGAWGDYLLLPELSCVAHSPARNQRLSLALVPIDDQSWDHWVRFFDRNPLVSPALSSSSITSKPAPRFAGSSSLATRRRRASLWIAPDDIFPGATSSSSDLAENDAVAAPCPGSASESSRSKTPSDSSGSPFASLRLRAFVVDNQRTTSTAVTVLNTWSSGRRRDESGEPARVQFSSWLSMFGEPAQLYNIMCIADTLHPTLQERSAAWLQGVPNARIPAVLAAEIRIIEQIATRRGSCFSCPECDITVARGTFSGELVLIKKWERISGSAGFSRADITAPELRGLRPLCLAVEPSLMLLAVQDDDDAYSSLCSSLAAIVPADGHLKAASSPRPTSEGGASSQCNTSMSPESEEEDEDLRKPTEILDIHVPYACANYSADGVVVKYYLFVTLEDGRRWCVGKRYSELEIFHRDIRELYLKDKDIGSRLSMFVGSGSAPSFPKFPGKSMTRATSFELKYILRRRRHLSAYFGELMRDRGKTFFRNPESMLRLVRLCSPAHDSLYQPDYNLKDQDGFMQIVEKVYVNAYFVAPDYISEQCGDKELVWAALKQPLPAAVSDKTGANTSRTSNTTTPRAAARAQSSGALLGSPGGTTPRGRRRSSSAARIKLAEQSPEFGRCSFSSGLLLQQEQHPQSICGLIPTFAVALPYARIMYDPNSQGRMMVHLRCEKSEQRSEILRRRDEIAGFYEYIATSKNSQIPDTSEARRFFATFRRENPPRLCVPYGDVRNGSSCHEDEVEEQALLLDSVQATSSKPPGATLQLIFANANEEGLARYPGGAPVVTLAAISQRPKYLETGVCKNSTHEEKKMRPSAKTNPSANGELPQERGGLGPVTIEFAEAEDVTWQAPQKCTCSETSLCQPKDNSFETRYTLASGHVILVHCPQKGQHRRRVGATSREMKRD